MELEIPLADLSVKGAQERTELLNAISDILDEGRFILSRNVAAFEDEFASYLGLPHVIGLNSGSDALLLTLKALAPSPNDEFILPAFGFVAAAEAVLQANARPVFCDIREDTYGLDPDQAGELIGPNTRGVIPVHLFGCPSDLDPVYDLRAAHDLFVIEDCAQVAGARPNGAHVGSQSDAATFSFFPTKNLGGIGDGGAVATPHPHLAKRVERLRRHGFRTNYVSEECGFNSRLDEIQAAVLRIRLKRLDPSNMRRVELADAYRIRLQDLPDVTLPQHRPGHVYHQFTIRVPATSRRHLVRHLHHRRVASKIYYPALLPDMPAFTGLTPVGGGYAVARRLTGEVVSLPIWVGMGLEHIDRVCESVRSFFEGKA